MTENVIAFLNGTLILPTGTIDDGVLVCHGGKIVALAEAHSAPVIPHAGQMHNYHVVMASLNSPMAEYFPIVDVEVGNELFWYIFRGEPKAKDGYIELDETIPGLGLTVDETALSNFEVIE